MAIGQTDSNATTTGNADTQARVRAKPLKPPVKRRIFKDTLLKKVIDDSLAKRDSIIKGDSVQVVMADSLNKSNANAWKQIVIKKPIDSFYLKLLDNPFLKTKAKPVFLVINERHRVSKDEIFYLVSGLLLFLAFVKLVFARYFTNVFRLFFQPTFRQKQTREQLQQNNLPSLLLNLFFIFSTSAYASFLLEYYHFAIGNFWLIFLYSVAALTIIYLSKYIFLSFAGWVFNVKEATDAYIFAVYLINKILGVLLIPFTLIIAFSQPTVINISITLSILLILLLFIYRYLVSYAPVRREVKVSPLHFLLYVCAFEVTPLLLIYKTLVIYLNKSL